MYGTLARSGQASVMNARVKRGLIWWMPYECKHDTFLFCRKNYALSDLQYRFICILNPIANSWMPRSRTHWRHIGRPQSSWGLPCCRLYSRTSLCPPCTPPTRTATRCWGSETYRVHVSETPRMKKTGVDQMWSQEKKWRAGYDCDRGRNIGKVFSR